MKGDHLHRAAHAPARRAERHGSRYTQIIIQRTGGHAAYAAWISY
jgi:hypothetical protein